MAGFPITQGRGDLYMPGAPAGQLDIVRATATPKAPSLGAAPSAPPANAPFRFGGSPEVMAKLGRLGSVGSWALAGLPIAFSAVGELGQSGNAMSDVAGAAGQGVGGLAGGLAAVAANPFKGVAWTNPIAFGLGAMGGGELLSNVARWGADQVQGLNDPLGKELNKQDRIFEANLAQRVKEAEVMNAYAEKDRQMQVQNAMIANQLGQSNLYQQALLGAASSGLDPNTAALLQGLS